MAESNNKAEVRIHSRSMVQPSGITGQTGRLLQIHLNQWELKLLSVDYIQKGLLFPQNPTAVISKKTIDLLLSSFSRTLDIFYPYAGRLATTVHHHHATPSLSIHLDCNDAGAEFIHATSDLTAADISSSSTASGGVLIPPTVRSLFPLSGAVNHDGHFLPVLAVQATVLADGSLFLGCSLNHAIADGFNFWHFFNTWSALCRSAGTATVVPPSLEKFFLPSTPPPILLPYRDASEFIYHEPLQPTKEGFFHFSRRSVARLKARANQEMGFTRISSLQALLAHVWRAATRARGFHPDVVTTYIVIVGLRKRLTPPLPDTSLGNAVSSVPAKARARELAENGLGWAAWQLNQAVAVETEEATRRHLEEWVKKPEFMTKQKLSGPILITGSSPRFDVYGNDFGWGPPATVRSGGGNKFDGKVTVYAGREGEGSMDLEICLSAVALGALMEDAEFMEAVGIEN